MSDTDRAKGSDPAEWTMPSARASAEDYYEDEAYTAPVKPGDVAMIQFLSTRTQKASQ